jgi:hypothetical protein
MVFIDGFGLGSQDAAINPLLVAEMPFIRKILSGGYLSREGIGEGIITANLVVKPTSATLEFSGTSFLSKLKNNHRGPRESHVLNMVSHLFEWE